MDGSRLGKITTGMALLVALMIGTLAVKASDKVEIPPQPDFEVIPATPAHIERLRAGGYVIYMRHGATDARLPDQIPVNLEDCASQRPLSDEGRRQLDQIGKDFAKLDLPYKAAYSSPFCRAVESARRVFDEARIEVDVPLRYTAAMPEREKAPAVERTRYWVSLPVKQAGTNRVVVAHGPNIAEIMEYLPPEGTMIIFLPLGESFEYVASIEPDHWPRLLGQLDELSAQGADE